MISVAMATFNGEKYIREQLKSLLEQDYKIDEIIIIDDASEDNTVNIISEIISENGSSNIKLCRNNENVGYKKNFAKAISMAQGDIIFLCDQDDVWKKNKVRVSVETILSHPEIKALNTCVDLIGKNGEHLAPNDKPGTANNGMIFRELEKDSLNKFDFDYIFRYNISPGCSMCFTKSIKECFLNEYKFGYVHDHFINLIAAAQNGCYFLNTPLINYRIHDSNAIGLSMLSGGKIKNNISREEKYNERLVGIEEPYKALTASDSSVLKMKIGEMISCRYLTLKNKSFAKWLKLVFKYYSIYNRYYSKKSLIGDLYFVFFNR